MENNGYRCAVYLQSLGIGVTQETERLASVIDEKTGVREQIAEIARLREVNRALLMALDEALEAFECASNGWGVDFYAHAKQVRAVIAKYKAEGRSGE